MCVEGFDVVVNCSFGTEEGDVVHSYAAGMDHSADVCDASDLSAGEFDVDEEAVFLWIFGSDAAAQCDAVDLVDVAHEPSECIDGVACASKKEVLWHLDAPRGARVDGSEVVYVVGFGHEEFADLSGVTCAFGVDEVETPSHGLCDEQDQAGAVNGFDDSLDLLHRVDHGFCDHDVFAVFKGG